MWPRASARAVSGSVSSTTAHSGASTRRRRAARARARRVLDRDEVRVRARACARARRSSIFGPSAARHIRSLGWSMASRNVAHRGQRPLVLLDVASGWPAPSPRMKRSGIDGHVLATTSCGSWPQMLRMPLATGTRSVASSSVARGAEHVAAADAGEPQRRVAEAPRARPPRRRSRPGPRGSGAPRSRRRCPRSCARTIRRTTSGASSTITSSRRLWTARMNVVSAPAPNATASTA